LAVLRDFNEEIIGTKDDTTGGKGIEGFKEQESKELDILNRIKLKLKQYKYKLQILWNGFLSTNF
jgi:hypothetical protein